MNTVLSDTKRRRPVLSLATMLIASTMCLGSFVVADTIVVPANGIPANLGVANTVPEFGATTTMIKVTVNSNGLNGRALKAGTVTVMAYNGTALVGIGTRHIASMPTSNQTQIVQVIVNWVPRTGPGSYAIKYVLFGKFVNGADEATVSSNSSPLNDVTALPAELAEATAEKNQ